MFKQYGIPFGIIIAIFAASEIEAQTADSVIRKAVEKRKAQSLSDDQYGFYQQVQVRKFDGNFQTIKDEEVRLYRTIWIKDEPYNQLLKFNGERLNGVERAKESRRRSDFMKTQDSKLQKSENCFEREVKKIEWSNLSTHYTYRFEPADSVAPYVISFTPKRDEFPTRTRFERVLREVRGKIWVDRDYNILKAEASLDQAVSFGLGLIAKIEGMHTVFTQQKFEDRWIPSSLQTTFQARIALLKNEQRELQVHWYDPYGREKPREIAAGR